MKLSLNPFKSSFDPVKEDFKLRKEQTNSDKENQMYAMANDSIQPGDLPVDGQAKAELTRWQQDLEYDLVKLAMGLRNYYMNPQTGNWEPKKNVYGEELAPLCSEECVAVLVELLRPYTSRNLMMSHYGESFILKKLRELADTVTLLIISKRKIFNIQMSNLTPIVRIFQGCAEPTFYRAFQGNEKKYLSSTNKYLYTQQDTGKSDKKKDFFVWPSG